MIIYDKTGTPIDPTANVDGSNHAITIDPAAPPTTSSKEVLTIQYLGGGRTDAEQSLHAYTATNYSHKEGIKEYSVSIFLSNDRRAILAVCDCQSWRVCKHIVHAWEAHVQAVSTGFLPRFPVID